MHAILDYILHIDVYLTTLVAHYGFWTYLVLFAIIFCETGLIILPFLPGDSLLFAAGSIAGQASHALSIHILLITLFIASLLGNKLNYTIGRLLGSRAFTSKSSLINQSYLQRTTEFYDKHGGKTIIIARFLPIIRTFAPFVAGAAGMKLKEFAFYNTISAILWIGSMLGAGFFLGSIPFISKHFSLVIYGIIIVSVLPAIIGIFLQKSQKRTI